LSLWRKLTFTPTFIVGATAFLALCLAKPASTSAQLLHATEGRQPSFEVVTIKPADPGETTRSFKISPGYFNARHASLIDLLKFAYEVKAENQVIGAPDWTTKELFDIEAKAGSKIADEFRDLPPERKMEPTRLMVQSMLAERFHLRTSFKAKDLPAYALVVAKGGTKLKQETNSPARTGVDNSATPHSPDVPHAPTLYMTDAHHLTGTNAPIDMLIGWLEHRPELDGRVIVDETGLHGGYDFVLDGVQEISQSPAAGPVPTDEGASIFTILREQLGLRLMPRKEHVEVLVIDDVEQPSPN
jgi:uncharacterized protein (TIGR03435 family)